MSPEIDFLSSQKKKIDESKQPLRAKKQRLIVGLLFYCVVTAAIFLILKSYQIQERQVSQQIGQKKSQITQFQNLEILQASFKQRLTAATKIISQTTCDYNQTLSYLTGISPADLNIESLVMSVDGQLLVNGQAKSTLGLVSFLDQLVSQNEPNYFKQIVLSGLSRDDQNIYSFNLDLNINNEKNY